MQTTTKTKRFRKRHWTLDTLDVEVLHALATIGPRNVHEIARKLEMPTETIWYRIKRLKSHFSLFVQGNVYHTNIGLRKIIMFADSFPGYEDMLYEAAKANDYWIYASQCFGGPTTCLGIYAIPDQNVEDFKQFIQRLEELQIAKSVKTFWSTCFQTVNLTPTWFNSHEPAWELTWNEWIEEVKSQNVARELPFTLLDPESFPQKADYMDIFILKELEKNAAVRFSELAKMLGTSIQNVRYHFENHIIKEKMLEGWQILIPHFGTKDSNTCFFIFEFRNNENLKRFAFSLLNKPFARTVGKVRGEDKLFVQIYLPREDFTQFLAALAKLIKGGFLKSYNYAIQDLTKSERQTISYELFKDGEWVYQHEEYLKRLKPIANKRHALH